MTSISPDRELVSAYAKEGSEAAFRGLVQRHVDLVFATAMRHTGNAALAEDITQNVFISLALKAPRLAALQTVAGWLHRATVFETKARIRSELRRRQRERTAWEIITLRNEGASPFAALLPLLDEALLNLRENDRLALVLRFLEERSLREVGSVLGIDEDAARKRVARALERLCAFFEKRGFTIPAGASGAALISSAAQAAPAAVAVSAAKAALAFGSGANGFKLFLFRLMTLTKTQTAVLCIIAMAAPSLLQNHANAIAARSQTELTAKITDAARRAAVLDEQLQQNRNESSRIESGVSNTKIQLDSLRSQLASGAARPAYRWDNNSPYARLPKKTFQQLRLEAAANHRGELTEQIKQALLMSSAEAEKTQTAMKHFLSAYESAEARQLKPVDPQASELEGRTPEQTKVFDVPYIGSNAMNQLRQDFFGQVASTLGDERAGIFTNALKWWMPINEDFNGIAGITAVFDFPFRAVFYQPAQGSSTIKYYIIGTSRSMGANVSASDVSALFSPYLQDWIGQMQTPSSEPQ